MHPPVRNNEHVHLGLNARSLEQGHDSAHSFDRLFAVRLVRAFLEKLSMHSTLHLNIADYNLPRMWQRYFLIRTHWQTCILKKIMRSY